MPEQAHRPRARVGEAEQRADHRRLAGAVGAEEAEGAAARHVQVDAVDGGALAEALGQAVRLDRRRVDAVSIEQLCCRWHLSPGRGRGRPGQLWRLPAEGAIGDCPWMP